jgi:hypothetical protein
MQGGQRFKKWFCSPALAGLIFFLPSVSRADVDAVVDLGADSRPISPLIYGANQTAVPRTCDRLGGNRWSAYNWVNNASNAGNDYRFQSDDYLVGHLPANQRDEPGAAVLGTLRDNAAALRATILTIPMAGYVSADKKGDGDVRNSGPDYLAKRFKMVAATKPGGHFSLSPDPALPVVYEDEFANWVNHHTSPRQQVLYDLDNEPDLWASTHAEIHPEKLTYAELVSKTIDFATAIKKVSPGAKVLGAVNYGWAGYRTLQGARDAEGRDFQAFFLQHMKAADAAAGKRLVDALDFHWYPEAMGNDAQGKAVRIFGKDASPGVRTARMAAPRSLWDATYVEKSWITRSLAKNDKPIRLLPRTQALIDANDPGMKMSMTEYDFGGGDDISGGIAEADVLGILGRSGVFAANWWDGGFGHRFVAAGFRMYLDFDGHGGRFGDIWVKATVSDDALASIYAATDSTDHHRLTILAINKTDSPQKLHLSIKPSPALGSIRAYQFSEKSALNHGVVEISRLRELRISASGGVEFEMPALSVTEFVMLPLDAGGK